jgi:hypothetical protein
MFDCYNLIQAQTRPEIEHYLWYQPLAQPSGQALTRSEL